MGRVHGGAPASVLRRGQAHLVVCLHHLAVDDDPSPAGVHPIGVRVAISPQRNPE
ncbi:MAG TPA: hypothetical protein VGR26_08805 [Acidimicrobiales bacterium]|nr:hypothetical protein [Acidimicrobiales bacterium]